MASIVFAGCPDVLPAGRHRAAPITTSATIVFLIILLSPSLRSWSPCSGRFSAADPGLHLVAETLELALPRAALPRGRWSLTGQRVRPRLGGRLFERGGRRALLAAAVGRSSPRGSAWRER